MLFYSTSDLYKCTADSLQTVKKHRLNLLFQRQNHCHNLLIHNCHPQSRVEFGSDKRAVSRQHSLHVQKLLTPK